MSKTEVKKYLKTLSQDEMLETLLSLYSSSKEAKNFLEFIVNPNPKEKLEEYKTILNNEFYPKRGEPKCRLSVCRKAINEFKKLGVEPSLLADLLVFHAELGARFTADYGDMEEAYYTSFENHYLATCEFLYKNDLIEHFKDRLHRIIEITEGCCWGFHDTLCEIYYEHVDEDE